MTTMEALSMSEGGNNGKGGGKRRTHRRKMVPIGPTENVRRRLDMTEAQFSLALGFTEHAYHDFVKNGDVTMTVHLAAEALARRQAASGLAADEVLILRIIKGIPTVTRLEDCQSCRIGDVEYLLVPSRG